MDFAQNGTAVIVRVGGSNGSYSTDDGAPGPRFYPPHQPEDHCGLLGRQPLGGDCVNGEVMYSTNFGSAWNNSSGLPSGVNVVSDRVNPLEFYAYSSSAGALYRSTDGGVTFPIVTGAPQWGSGIYADYAAEGDLWIPNWTLNHSIDKGATFNVPSGSVGSITALGFGQAAPGSSIPTLFMAGQESGVSGIYRSLDGGGSWSQINDGNHQWGNVSVLAGDEQVFGRVYIGTSGRGIVYGDDPQACFTCHYRDKTTPAIAWNKPAAVSVGAVLSSAELNATASVGGNSLPGTFIYTPSAGTVTSATGTVTLKVRFEPEDYADYNSVTAEVTLKVNGGSLDTARITWPAPASITYGTALSSSQLDATANYPGTFAYSPALGTVLGGGSQKLSVTFTPINPTEVAPAFATTAIRVAKATPTVTVTPASSGVTVAQPLGVTIAVSGPGSTPAGSVVLSCGSYSFAAALISGSAAFTIPSGSLPVGSDTLTATYTPDSGSSASYGGASGTAPVTVTPLITPTVAVTPDQATHPYAENLDIAVTVSGGSSTPTPSGSVVLTSGSFTSTATLNSGSAIFYIQPGTLPQGFDPLHGRLYSRRRQFRDLPPFHRHVAAYPDRARQHRHCRRYRHTSQSSPDQPVYLWHQFDESRATSPTCRRPLSALVEMRLPTSTGKLFTYNAGGDYFYEDFGFGDGYGTPSYRRVTQFTVNSGSHQLTTMPMLDWVAKESERQSRLELLGRGLRASVRHRSATIQTRGTA